MNQFTKADGTFAVVSRIHPNARVFLEHDTFYVGVQYDYGRLILGWAPTVKQAVDAAIARNEG